MEQTHQPQTTSLTVRSIWIVTTIVVWFGCTYLAWIGYYGSADDFNYCSYAFFLDAAPSNHWQFRMPAVLAIRAAYGALGPTEFAACVPSLLSSLLTALAVAWLVDWPRTLNWKTQASMLLVCTMPLDATFRTIPLAGCIAVGLLALGTICLIKGKGWIPYFGALLLGMGFLTHEINFFYVAIVCLVATWFDWRTYWKPMLATVLVSGGLVLIEGVTYGLLLDNPMARYANAVVEANNKSNYQYRFGGSALRFYLWPMQCLVFCRAWGFDLIILLGSALAVWKRLNRIQKIVFVSGFLYWFWLGYGTQVPWAYRPRSRAIHYYLPLTLFFAGLLPFTLAELFARRQRWAQSIVALLLATHVALLLAAGSWGQDMDVSRGLLHYARQHSDEDFLTDFRTRQAMSWLNGFHAPENVADVTRFDFVGEITEDRRLSEVELETIAAAGIDGILLNRERRPHASEELFQQVVKRFDGPREIVVPVQYRRLLIPLTYLIEPKDFFVRSRGGEFVRLAEPKETP